MSVGSLDALKVRALLERVCSVPTTLSPTSSPASAQRLALVAEVVSLAGAQLTCRDSGARDHDAGGAGGGCGPADERTPERQHARRVHAVEHLHQVAPADGARAARQPGARRREPAAATRALRLRRAARASPPRTPRATELGSSRDGLLRPTHPRKRVEHPVPMLPVMGASCGVGSACLVAASSRPATAAGGGAVPPRAARGRAGLSSATRRKNPPTPRGARRHQSRRRQAAAVVARGAPRRRAAARVGLGDRQFRIDAVAAGIEIYRGSYESTSLAAS